jgi:predicted GH43/DUF377 family glycosyl hydrolase
MPPENFYGSLLKIVFQLCLLFFVYTTEAQPGNPYLPSQFPDRIILNVTQDASTSMAVNWRTEASVTESFAEIAIASADPRFTEKVQRIRAKSEKLVFEDTPAAMYHAVVFDHLVPNTKYAYRVGQGENWSEWIHFNTAGKTGEKFSFLYYGDVQVNIRSMWSRVAREAYAKAPDARVAIYAGDLINKANRDVEWGDWFEAGGFIHSMIPGFPTPGNHDHYEGPDGKPLTSVFWRPQFTLPENGPEGLEETCYYADIQGTRFISLNSDRAEESDEYLEKQRVWMEKVLSSNPNKWTCVTFHHPIYSPKSTRDNKRMRETFKPLFDKYKVDLVLQGHDHTYARGMSKIPMQEKGAVSATMYVVSVSGPKMTDSDVEKQDWMDRSALYTQLFHVVTIDQDKLAFQTFTATGELFDAFDLIKQKGKSNKVIEKVPPVSEGDRSHSGIKKEPAAFPAEIVSFIPYKNNPLFKGTGDTATWDEKIRERGFILKEGKTYYMWYCGYTRKTGGQMKYLGLATSQDGLKWTRSPENPVEKTTWIEDMFVVKSEGTYYMFAESKDDIPRLLTSKDKVHWQDQGALDIRLKSGIPISKGPFGTPTVWKEGSNWYLFYERNDSAVWLAVSQDLKVWTNVQDEPVLTSGPEDYDKFAVAFNQVIRYQGLYYAYYHASAFKDWHEWTTNVAVSKDLVHWKKYEKNPVLMDNKSSGILVEEGDKFRFYTMHPEVNVYFPR